MYIRQCKMQNASLSSILICLYTLVSQVVLFLLIYSIGPESLGVCTVASSR